MYVRDLKLENFVLQSQNLNAPIVLVDFGLAVFCNNGCNDMVVGNVGSAYYRGFYELQIDGNFYQ
jgi:serine/threonine protein kinase